MSDLQGVETLFAIFCPLGNKSDFLKWQIIQLHTLVSVILFSDHTTLNELTNQFIIHDPEDYSAVTKRPYFGRKIKKCFL